MQYYDILIRISSESAADFEIDSIAMNKSKILHDYFLYMILNPP